MASIMKRNDENAAGLPDDDEAGDDAAAAASDEVVNEKPGKSAKSGRSGKGERSEAKPVEYAKPTTASGRTGKFFTIYKSGQGYWTRMCTLIGVGLLGLMLAYTLFDKIPPFIPEADTTALQKRIDQNINAPAADKLSDAQIAAITTQIASIHDARSVLARQIALGVAGGFLVIYTIVALYMMNKPANVDFLIATDSEMKKVNWTSRKELIGSTKIVVIFMLLIAFFLFSVDWIFHLIFYLIHVLKVPPPGIPGGG